MRFQQIHLRDTIATWPGLTLQLRLLPWQWRVWCWRDWPDTASFTVGLGPLEVQFFANRPMFVLESRETGPVSYAVKAER